MLLPQQIQAILYHLMMGWFYGCTFSFLCSLTVYLHFKLLKGTAEILFHISFILLAFYGLYQINGGVTKFHLVKLKLIGIIKVRRKKRAKRRAEHEKRKKKKRKQKEAIQSDEEVL